MNLKKKLFLLAGSLILALAASFSAAGTASATNETASIYLKMDPLKGGLFKEAFRPVNWQVGTIISTPDPTIQPLKQSNLRLSGNTVTFNPDPAMPVCPDSKINPNTVSVPVETAIAACPESIIGNGTATFALAQSTNLPRNGVMIVFNGGLQKTGPLKGRPRIMIYAYSYDVEVGVYTEAALSRNGHLDFDVPVLTADSSVTSLNLSIPGKPASVEFPMKGITAKVPAGRDPEYAQAKCATGTWSYGAEFVLGDRPEGAPPGPSTRIDKSGEIACSGASGKARFGTLKIKGPARVKAGTKRSYRVTLKNTGTATARGAELAVRGKGASGKARAGNIAPGRSKTVTVKTRFSRPGKVRAKFKVTAARTAAKIGTRAIIVR